MCGGQRKPPDLFGRLSLSIVCVSHAQKTRARHATAAECAKLGFVSVLFFKMVLRGPPIWGGKSEKNYGKKFKKLRKPVRPSARKQGNLGRGRLSRDLSFKMYIWYRKTVQRKRLGICFGPGFVTQFTIVPTAYFFRNGGARAS